MFYKSDVNLISMGIRHVLSAKYPYCCQPKVSPGLCAVEHTLTCLFFRPQGKCHSIFPACHHKSPAGSCRCYAAVAITPWPMCCSGYRRILQGSWTEVKKKCSVTRCILLSTEHPKGVTVGMKTSAAAHCLKYLTPLCRTPSFFITRKQMYTRFWIQVSKQRSLPLRRTAAGDPTHGKITVLVLSRTICLHHDHFA